VPRILTIFIFDMLMIVALLKDAHVNVAAIAVPPL
jgi:hypothetical protein